MYSLPAIDYHNFLVFLLCYELDVIFQRKYYLLSSIFLLIVLYHLAK